MKIITTLAFLALALPAIAEAGPNTRSRTLQVGDGARSGAALRGDHVAAGGQRGATADGKGNLSAGGRGGFSTDGGAQGRRQASYERDENGNVDARREGELETDRGSARRSGSWMRDENGNASGERNTSISNAETGNQFDASTTYTPGKGFSREAGCTDASGNSITCGSR